MTALFKAGNFILILKMTNGTYTYTWLLAYPIDMPCGHPTLNPNCLRQQLYTRTDFSLSATTPICKLTYSLQL